MRSAEIAHRGIMLISEGRQVFADLSVDDNLILGAYTRPRRERLRVVADFARAFALFPILHERGPASSS